jgi:hypothetical protein
LGRQKRFVGTTRRERQINAEQAYPKPLMQYLHLALSSMANKTLVYDRWQKTRASQQSRKQYSVSAGKKP